LVSTLVSVFIKWFWQKSHAEQKILIVATQLYLGDKAEGIKKSMGENKGCLPFTRFVII